jgi:hypothetical protein
MSYVIRHGRRIEIETQPDPPEVAAKLQKQKKRKQEAFAMVPLWWAGRAAKATKAPEVLVCVELWHRAWKAKGQSFTMPNGGLAEHGITRKVKSRILRSLEVGGEITVERQPRKTPKITLTGKR